ncbi:oxidoreductase [Sinorhizobium meliloti]|uniref:oxidoreductase n=1 Tax=Rhizobium meliloti TaxID=382 RepID=UPI000FD8938C|nr:oxidoreductase [Sinorhizobium meliloti]RVQ17755.1 oxidoreductase [Sinorhizobium meliloti]RVQ55714.1 oxidoreductase [Sinorhizobium meliloti]
MALSDEQLREAVSACQAAGGNKQAAADALGMAASTLKDRLVIASRRGFLPPAVPTMPGFEVTRLQTGPRGTTIEQRPEKGGVFEVPEGHRVKGVSSFVGADGRTIASWVKTQEDIGQREEAMRAALDAFKDELPRAAPTAAPKHTIEHLLNQYTITDHHLGGLAWGEETGGSDYDTRISERLIIDWFTAAISQSPPAKRAIFAQLGDFLHYDSFKSITPEHGHQLDSDSRYPKMVRAAIRIVRTVIDMLLEKHEQVDVLMCDANHDPAGGVWLREMLSAFYENEPRVTVDTNPGTYSFIEHGDVSLFYHHGHRRGVKNVDSILVGKFRKLYGRTNFSYAHTGHKHCDELKTTDLMKVEQHETLAAPDAYGSNWMSGRSAKVISYHKKFGEVGRITLTPEMVSG